MKVASTELERWRAVRTAISDTGERFAGLVRSVEDPATRAVGDWSIAETAAHVATIVVWDRAAAFATMPDEWGAVTSRALDARVGDVAGLNVTGLELFGERDPVAIAESIEAGVDEFLASTWEMDGSERVIWLGGLELPVSAVLGHLLFELLVHGHDIGRASDRAWDVPTDQALLAWETFVLPFLGHPQSVRFTGAENRRGTVRCEFRVRGSAPVLFVFDNGRIEVVEPGSARPDFHLSADPTAFLLVKFGRMSPVIATLRGKMLVWGRRPWKLAKLMRVLQTP